MLKENESTPLSSAEELLLSCRFSTGISVPNVKLMSMAFSSRSASSQSSTCPPLLYFNSGDSPAALNPSEELRSISNLSEGLELCIVAVRGRGTGGLVKTHEGVPVTDVGLFGNEGLLQWRVSTRMSTR